MFKKSTNLILLIIVLLFPLNAFSEIQKIRAGHFPNVTHAPALIARATNHFEKIFGENVKIEWKIFHAGPQAIEALFAKELDILYVGPNPAVNGYVRSRGEALRIISGVASGGAAFVVHEGSGIEKFEDIKGKRVASPQKGNTQDVSLLHLMHQKELKSRHEGGDVELFNISGGDQIIAFIKNQVDAIWTVEPWVSRLVSEANGKILFEEEELWPRGIYATTVLVVRTEFMNQNPNLVQEWVSGQIDLIDNINKNLEEAKKIFNQELQMEIGKPLPPNYLNRSFEKIRFTVDPMESSVVEYASRAYVIGYLGKEKRDLTNLYEPSFLNEAKNKSKKLISL